MVRRSTVPQNQRKLELLKNQKEHKILKNISSPIDVVSYEELKVNRLQRSNNLSPIREPVLMMSLLRVFTKRLCLCVRVIQYTST